MTALRVMPVPPVPAHLVKIAVPRLNKCDHIEEYLKQLKARDYDWNYAEVIEERHVSAAAWNEIVTGLLDDREWLAGKGGAASWAVTILSVEELKVWPTHPAYAEAARAYEAHRAHQAKRVARYAEVSR